MKTVTIHCFDKHSGASFSESVLVNNGEKVVDKEKVKAAVNDIFARVPFTNWYYEAETFDDLTEIEKEPFVELDIDVL